MNHPARASTVHPAFFARIVQGKTVFHHGARRRDARLHREGRGFETLSAHHAAAIVSLISGGSCSVAALQHFAANWALARHGHELTMKL
jgi:hypothetical protein